MSIVSYIHQIGKAQCPTMVQKKYDHKPEWARLDPKPAALAALRDVYTAPPFAG